MLTNEDIHNIIILLDRVEYKGLRESSLAIELVNKLERIKEENAGSTTPNAGDERPEGND